MLLSFVVKFLQYLSFEKNDNKQKEAGIGPCLKSIKSDQKIKTLPQLQVIDDEQHPTLSTYF